MGKAIKKQAPEAAFYYGAVSADKAASARAAAERIRGRMQLAAESIIEVGRELIEQKRALGHGNFLPWIAAEFGMSQSTATNWMQVANQYEGKFVNVANLSISALYALAAPSTPPEVRAEVEERAANGEKVTAAEIEELKKQLAAAKDEAKQAEAEVMAQAKRAEIAESANERLSDTVTDLQDEMSRLSEDGVIHVAPQTARREQEDDEGEDGDDDVSPRATAHRAKMAFLVRAGEAEKYAFFPPDQKPDRDILRQAELTMNAWKSLITKLKNGE
jgi:hypothetical protein